MSASGTVVYNKLVRDRIPEIIAADGHTPAVRVLAEAEYRQALLAKLGEEALELAAASSEEEHLGELADLQEVVNALTESYGFSPNRVQDAAAKKRRARGGFRRQLFLESTAPA
jgi:predicted house-cleaning noncanonical NTP pyrophosphatase (MazG superfamily)